MRTKTISLIVFALLSAPLAAIASSVTYEFIGVVTSATGADSSIAAGTTISGTYVFNFGNAVAAQSSGTVGSPTSDWFSVAQSGSYYGLPTPSAYVFSSTAHVGNISYSTSAPAAYQNSTVIEGYGSGTIFNANEQEYSNYNTGTSSGIYIAGSPTPYSINGLPVLYSGANTIGSFSSTSNGNLSQVKYTLTSLTPVPLPSTAWLLLSSLGGLGIIGIRRKSS